MPLAYFYTDDGVLVPAITAEQMREVDRIAVEAAAPSLQQMMENAGRSLALTGIDHLGSGWRDVTIVVAAGSGGNGGGSVCAARHLANHGGDVVLVLSRANRLSPVTEQQLHIFEKTSGRIESVGSFEPGLILDAVVGYGLDGAPQGSAQEMIAWLRDGPTPVISLDVPSGLDSTTGEILGDAVEAVATVTLALPKTGLVSPLAGELWLADLGIPREVFVTAGIHLPRHLFDGRYRIHLERTR